MGSWAYDRYKQEYDTASEQLKAFGKELARKGCLVKEMDYTYPCLTLAVCKRDMSVLLEWDFITWKWMMRGSEKYELLDKFKEPGAKPYIFPKYFEVKHLLHFMYRDGAVFYDEEFLHVFKNKKSIFAR